MRRDGRGDGRPAETGRALVGLGERPAGQEDGGDRAARRATGSAQVVGEERGLLGRPGRRREALGELAPATHGSMVYRAGDGAAKPWFPEALTGSRVVLRRHVPANIDAFLRWYADPEIARLARYQATPMRPEEIERFFAARVVGPDALAMAVHEKATDRLVGTCAFSQLDGENGSALYHITIGESDAWGQGYGTEATQLMLDHAFGTLGLHRIALYVFEFNERAIRAYTALRLRRRGPVARVDLARRPLVGRAGDERARVGLAGDARGGRTMAAEQRGRRRAAPECADSTPSSMSRSAPAHRTGCDGRSGGGDDDAGSRPRTRPGPTSAS